MRMIYTRCTASRRNAAFAALTDAGNHRLQAMADTKPDLAALSRDSARWLIEEARLDRLRGADYPMIP